MITLLLDLSCFEIDRLKRSFQEIENMEKKKESGLAVLLAAGLVFIIRINANLLSKSENRELTRAVFYVV
jgi:hypothetical protein